MNRHLRLLAGLHGVQLSYRDALDGRRRHAPTESVLAVLKALGAPIDRPEDAKGALRARRDRIWSEPSEPVLVAWQPGALRVPLRVRGAEGRGRARLKMTLEAGGERSWDVRLSDLPVRRRGRTGSARFEERELSIREPLPWGYHRLALEADGRSQVCLVISAPVRALVPEDGGRFWGVFMPLYAASGRHGWGAGDFTSLDTLATWVAEQGGAMVGTLPLLACFLDEPFDPSPYSPISRLFWNEFYIDVPGLEEFDRCAPARRIASAPPSRRELESLREGRLVDYRRGMRLKRRVLEELAGWTFRQEPARREGLESYLAAHPELETYARFRAYGERHGADWRRWPAGARRGRLRAGDVDESARRYHIYVQWCAQRQMSLLGTRGEAAGLYLDLPVGVHPDGYDVWRFRDEFVERIGTGAPPDDFFTGGQDWGLPPPHPEGIRRRGYGCFIQSLRHHLAHASALRLDHVMGLHRLYWVPRGAGATRGVYVRYRPEEMYAILVLESRRAGALLVGEDLGTVPRAVPAAMRRHGLHRMKVWQFEPETAAPPAAGRAAGAVASLGTHDTPTFAGFLKGLDIADRQERGLVDARGRRRLEKERTRLVARIVRRQRRAGRLGPAESSTAALLRACLEELAAGGDSGVLVGLEDLWLETRPQNKPGTGPEFPNWRRKPRHDLASMAGSLKVTALLGRVNRARRRGSGP